jgi:hypothetical protein
MMGLTKLAFTRTAYALCTEKGSLSPPDFWIDKELSQGEK